MGGDTKPAAVTRPSHPLFFLGFGFLQPLSLGPLALARCVHMNHIHTWPGPLCTPSLQPHCSHLLSRRLLSGPLSAAPCVCARPPLCPLATAYRTRWRVGPAPPLHRDPAPRRHLKHPLAHKQVLSRCDFGPVFLKYQCQCLGFRGCGSFSHAGKPDAGSACSGDRARPCKSLLWGHLTHDGCHVYLAHTCQLSA